MVVGRGGKLLDVNPILCGWLGYERQELLELNEFQTLLSIGSRLFHHTHWMPLLAMQGSLREIQIDMLHKSGAKIPTLVNATRRTFGDEKVSERATKETDNTSEGDQKDQEKAEEKGKASFAVDYIAVFLAKDRKSYETAILDARKEAEKSFSELKKTKQALDKLNQTLLAEDQKKNEFLATLAHELRNPLVPMRNVVELIKEDQTDPEEKKELIDVLQRQLGQITHLVDDLLDIARISKGAIVLKRTELDVHTALNDAVLLAMPLIDKKEHTLNLDFPEHKLFCFADPTRFTQIVLNLLTNAAKYTEHGGVISITLSHDADTLSIVIKDNGIGVAQDKQREIFNMFSQLDDGQPMSSQGLGIGLSLVKGLVELHDGTITVFSEGRDKGCEFSVSLPIMQKPDTTDEGSHSSSVITAVPKSAENKRALVVDDNRDAADTTARILLLQGLDVQVCYDGRSAISMWKTFRPNLMLLDIGLPDISGYEVAREICKLKSITESAPDTSIIAITGWGQEADKRKALEAGCKRHFTKPISMSQLKTIL